MKRKSPAESAGFRRAGLAQYLELSASAHRKGELPAPIKIGRVPFWLREVIDRWLAEKSAA